jgi:hypothetical protein
MSGRRFPVADHVFGHGRLTHFDSNLQQFPMNARRSPARVGVGAIESASQFTQPADARWSSNLPSR